MCATQVDADMAGKRLMLGILVMCILLATIRHASCAYDFGDVNSISTTKAKKYHPPPVAPRYMHPPPAPAHATHPAPPSGVRKAPSAKQGQAPFATVESEAAFTLYHGRDFKVIQNLIHNFTYLLIQQGGDSNGKDWDLNISVFPDPLTNFTIDNNSAVAFLELLGCVGRLKGVPISFGLASPCLFQLILEGAIATLQSTDDLVDLEASSYTSSFEALFGSFNTVQLPTKEQNQSNFISFDSSVDRGPLQRAEWIKFLASFVDMEDRANSVYEKIQSNYQCLNASHKGDDTSKPLIAWFRYNKDLNMWSFSNDTYKLQLSLDAGGSNLDAFNLSTSFSMSIKRDIEKFHAIASTLDVVIDETSILDPSWYTLDNVTLSANITDLSGFPFLAKKRLWRYDKRIGINNAIDWTEGAIAQPQVVLRDLIEVLYPPFDIQSNYIITYFRNIALGESFVNTTTSECQHMDRTTALEPTIIPCTTQTRF